MPDEKKRSDWFAENEEELLVLTKIMNKASKQMRNTKTHETILTYREARSNLRKCKRRAQSEWSNLQGLKSKKSKAHTPEGSGNRKTTNTATRDYSQFTDVEMPSTS
jgi:hypothetical protein